MSQYRASWTGLPCTLHRYRREKWSPVPITVARELHKLADLLFEPRVGNEKVMYIIKEVWENRNTEHDLHKNKQRVVVAKIVFRIFN